jgi:hypothetical protein
VTVPATRDELELMFTEAAGGRAVPDTDDTADLASWREAHGFEPEPELLP